MTKRLFITCVLVALFPGNIYFPHEPLFFLQSSARAQRTQIPFAHRARAVIKKNVKSFRLAFSRSLSPFINRVPNEWKTCAPDTHRAAAQRTPNEPSQSCLENVCIGPLCAGSGRNMEILYATHTHTQDMGLTRVWIYSIALVVVVRRLECGAPTVNIRHTKSV